MSEIVRNFTETKKILFNNFFNETQTTVKHTWIYYNPLIYYLLTKLWNDDRKYLKVLVFVIKLLRFFIAKTILHKWNPCQ